MEYVDIAPISDGQVIRNDFFASLFFLLDVGEKIRDLSAGAPAASALVSRGSLAINYIRPTCIETSFDETT